MPSPAKRPNPTAIEVVEDDVLSPDTPSPELQRTQEDKTPDTQIMHDDDPKAPKPVVPKPTSPKPYEPSADALKEVEIGYDHVRSIVAAEIRTYDERIRTLTNLKAQTLSKIAELNRLVTIYNTELDKLGRVKEVKKEASEKLGASIKRLKTFDNKFN